MIKLEGAKLIFATSFGYFDPYMLDMAKKYPTSSSVTPRPVEGRQAPYECRLLLRISESGALHERHRRGASTTSNKLGFIAAKPISSVPDQHQLIAAGRPEDQSEGHRAIDLHRRLVLAGSRSRSRKRSRRRRLRRHHLSRRGPKVVVETAEKRGMKSCGHNASQASLAPKGFITGAEYKWSTIYKSFAADRGQARPCRTSPRRL